MQATPDYGLWKVQKHLDNLVKFILIRKLERILIKLYRQNVLFNQTYIPRICVMSVTDSLPNVFLPPPPKNGERKNKGIAIGKKNRLKI